MYSLIQEKSLGSIFYIPSIKNKKADELILIVHGFTSAAKYMRPLENQLINQNFATFNFDVSATIGSFSNLVSELQEQVQSAMKYEDRYSKVHLVGHSFGGLLCRLIQGSYEFENMGNFVTVGTPWKKAPQQIMDTMKDGIEGKISFAVREGEEIFNHCINQIPKNKKYNVGLIAGNKPYSKESLSNRVYNIRKDLINGNEPNDGLVTVDSAHGLHDSRITDKHIIPYNHIELIDNPIIGPLVAKFLQTNKF